MEGNIWMDYVLNRKFSISHIKLLLVINKYQYECKLVVSLPLCYLGTVEERVNILLTYLVLDLSFRWWEQLKTSSLFCVLCSLQTLCRCGNRYYAWTGVADCVWIQTQPWFNPFKISPVVASQTSLLLRVKDPVFLVIIGKTAGIASYDFAFIYHIWDCESQVWFCGKSYHCCL